MDRAFPADIHFDFRARETQWEGDRLPSAMPQQEDTHSLDGRKYIPGRKQHSETRERERQRETCFLFLQSTFFFITNHKHHFKITCIHKMFSCVR